MIRWVKIHFYFSLQLAKFFCEILTESLKVYERRSEEIPQSIRRPEEPINQDLLFCVHKCDKSMVFWQNFRLDQFSKKTDDYKKPTVASNAIGGSSQMPRVFNEDDDDDDDDDDLNPIETIEAPVKCDIAYIRDFIETLNEKKTYDEVVSTFSNLPNVIKFQLQHEHQQVGLDLLKILVTWENEFDSPEIELHRKTSLCNALKANVESNSKFLCSFIPKDETRVPQQLLILEVLSKVASQANLTELQALARIAFQDLLQPGLFESREVPVRIPLILFYHRLLCTLPTQMIQSEMVVAYLNSLTSMTNVDKALEQTISFSLHHLVDRLRDIQLLQNDQTQSEDLSSQMSNLRSWLWNLQDNPLGNIKNVSDPS